MTDLERASAWQDFLVGAIESGVSEWTYLIDTDTCGNVSVTLSRETRDGGISGYIQVVNENGYMEWIQDHYYDRSDGFHPYYGVLKLHA